ncbi:hypothetical protein VV02_11800 [Luteipulveratus mongoliensis]|uniref:Uncharacterized protein n=1 Tax=Luteipulveratus mongoliensis TaxID=571913 RepID=A0A0K1JI53_9MICO|nr:hypothetical protein VV02_11800 [Luteipulveratus mongoliensis]
MCGTKEADLTARDCKKPEKDVTTSAVSCSALLPKEATGTINVTLFRNGAQVYTANATRQSDMQPLFLNFSVGHLQMPGGTYACQFKAGARTWTGSTTFKGPAGQASQTMACDGATMYRAGTIAHCARGAATLTAPRSIGCSSLITDVLGKTVEVRVQTPSGPYRAAGKQTNGATIVQLAADAATLGGTISTGAYSCTFLVDGRQVSKVDFTVTG